MAYEAEMITYSQKIFYYLLCHGALSDLDAEVNDLYRAYVEHEEIEKSGGNCRLQNRAVRDDDLSDAGYRQ